MKLTKRRSGVLAAIAGVVALSVYALMPRPIVVDVATVAQGPLRVTVEEDGVTRVRERYEITTPVAGRVRRIELHPGDPVTAGQSLATIETVPLDPKLQAQLAARLESARRTREEADALVARALAAVELARRETARLRRLSREDIASRQALDQAVASERNAAETLDAARHRVQSATFDAEAAHAALESGETFRLTLRSPVAGRVLRVVQESETVVPSGARILDVGDPSALEIAIDVLSEDAVAVRPGNRVLIEQWGGPGSVEARVRVVEPSAFTKVSALGVEEQRVNVLADFVKRPETMGDQFRVDTRIVVWEGEVLRVPATAIFGGAGHWSVFVIDGRKARLRNIGIGHMGAEDVEVTSGLRAGERVVIHPSDRLGDGVSVRVSP
jgi:HlyD family secretion protein